MIIRVNRVYKSDYTIGHMYLNNEYFCDTLEDKCRIVNNDCSLKIYGETAIPEGMYDVEMIWWERHNNYYPHIKDVPCFTGIMIHSGSDIYDTEGCILVGMNKTKGALSGGMLKMEELRAKLKDEQNIKIVIL